MEIKLWLDDIRDPANHGCIGWVWVLTADEAIEKLKTGEVTEASLDHDLTIRQSLSFSGYGFAPSSDDLTGYDVVNWMEQNNVWPSRLRVHSMNPAGRKRMEQVIAKYYTDANDGGWKRNG